MNDFAIFWEWLSFGMRWLHVITAIAWIGSSFYFIALDLGLVKREGMPEGAHGEEWQVHGGGFYHIQKYLVAPAALPEHLTWFKWEAYATWLTGFALLAVIYYAGADLYLVDREVLDISARSAILISLASLLVGWGVYDLLCRSPVGRSQNGLMLVLFLVLVAMAWGYAQIFSGRAALLHLGAFTATVMSANVFMIIIPNQKKVVAALKAGETPDPKLGVQAKQRSLHNNYLTLPVLFLMLSNHYPLAFATRWNWVIASLVFLMGVTIRHYFNTRHAGRGSPAWTWAATAVLFVLVIWLSTEPRLAVDEGERALSPWEQRLAASGEFPEVRDTVLGRCAMCHAREPVYEGILAAPKAVVLESDADIVAHARAIYLQAGRSRAMPPANVTAMTAAERRVIAAWYEDPQRERSE